MIGVLKASSHLIDANTFLLYCSIENRNLTQQYQLFFNTFCLKINYFRLGFSIPYTEGCFDFRIGLRCDDPAIPSQLNGDTIF